MITRLARAVRANTWDIFESLRVFLNMKALGYMSRNSDFCLYSKGKQKLLKIKDARPYTCARGACVHVCVDVYLDNRLERLVWRSLGM